MKNAYSNFRPKAFNLGRTFLLSLIFLAISGVATAQASQDFASTPIGTNNYVDMGSGAVQHILVNNPLPQTAPNAPTVGTTLGYQATFTPTRMPSIGLTDGELFGAIDVTIPSAPNNNMGSLSIDFVANPPNGDNLVYLLDDPDGLVTLRFNPVVIGAATSFSMEYIIHNTSYENSAGVDDRLEVYLVNMAGGARTDLLTLTNDAMEDLESWQMLTADLTDMAGQTMQLVVAFDTNAGSEEAAIDNISFSSGTVMPDWPVCQEPSMPTLTQFPGTVCPGSPFRLLIDGVLNNATQWVIYDDAAGTNQVAATSGNSYDFFAGAVPGATYYVRGEGECATAGDLVAVSVSTAAPGDCTQDATPGSSFEEPLGSSEDYFDTGDPLAAHDLVNNQGQPTVSYRSVAQELGFTTQFIPTRTSTSGEAGLTDGDAVGVSNDGDFAFPDGDQGLVLEDTDGTTVVFMSLIDLTGLTGVTVSFDYFVNSTSYEESATGTDSFAAGIARGFTPLEEIIAAEGDGNIGLPGLATGVWTTLTYEITGNYTEPVQLIFQADFDAGTERILIDNVSFSAGTIVCEDIDAPIVSCPAPVMIDAGEDCTAMPSFMATATDDCSDAVTITYSQDSGSEFAVGVTPVMVTATDDSGTSSTCTFNVTVNDVTPPTITCTDITVQLDSMDDCTFIFTDTSFDPVATDNCGDVTIFTGDLNGGSTLNGEFADIDSDGFSIRWTATDAAGLTSTCTQLLTVINPPSCFTTSVTPNDPSDFSSVVVTPNPFTVGTTISFRLPANIPVNVDVYDLSGRILTTDVIAPSGNNTYSWNWNAQQQALPAGMYFARLQAAGSVYTQRLILLK